MWREESNGKNVYMGYCLFGLIILGEKKCGEWKGEGTKQVLKNTEKQTNKQLSFIEIH